MAKTNPFTRDSDFYTVQSLESYIGSASKQDIAALRAEYTRLRDIAQKRVKRLGKSEFRETSAYTSHAEGFAKLRELDPRDLPKAMAELSKFVNAKTSTLAGQKETRQRTIETFRKQGINLTPKNYMAVFAVMKELRKQKKTYDSERIVNAVNSAIHKGMNIDDLINSNRIDDLIMNSEKIDSIPYDPGEDMDEFFDELEE